MFNRKLVEEKLKSGEYRVCRMSMLDNDEQNSIGTRIYDTTKSNFIVMTKINQYAYKTCILNHLLPKCIKGMSYRIIKSEINNDTKFNKIFDSIIESVLKFILDKLILNSNEIAFKRYDILNVVKNIENGSVLATSIINEKALSLLIDTVACDFSKEVVSVKSDFSETSRPDNFYFKINDVQYSNTYENDRVI